MMACNCEAQKKLERIKSMFKRVEGLPNQEGWYLFIPKDVSNWIVPFTFILVMNHKGELQVVEDGDSVPFKHWCKGNWFGPVSSELLEILND